MGVGKHEHLLFSGAQTEISKIHTASRKDTREKKIMIRRGIKRAYINLVFGLGLLFVIDLFLSII